MAIPSSSMTAAGSNQVFGIMVPQFASQALKARMQRRAAVVSLMFLLLSFTLLLQSSHSSPDDPPAPYHESLQWPFDTAAAAGRGRGGGAEKSFSSSSSAASAAGDGGVTSRGGMRLQWDGLTSERQWSHGGPLLIRAVRRLFGDKHEAALAADVSLWDWRMDYPGLSRTAGSVAVGEEARRSSSGVAMRGPALEARTGRGLSQSVVSGELVERERRGKSRELRVRGKGSEGKRGGKSGAMIEEVEVVAAYEPCGSELVDYTPCEDPGQQVKFPRDMLMHRERHCPLAEEIKRCLIPPPEGYKIPPPWPVSRDEAWYVNVPYKHLTEYKKEQNWVRYDKEREKFIFPGGGTMFKSGAREYIEELSELLPLKGGVIRTVLDTGCGVGSFGAFMFDWDAITLSIAPMDEHEAQVQFALERGLPAMLGVLATKRLPFPARAFDLAHCSRCLIPWWADGGRYLTELDRVLRPGGFWVLTGPPINWQRKAKAWKRSPEELSSEQERIEAAAAGLCWRKVVERGAFAIWQKPLTGECVKKRKKGVGPPLCPEGQSADVAWYVRLDNCVSRMPPADWSGVAGGQVAPWPSRLSLPSPRIRQASIPKITDRLFIADGKRWQQRVAFYEASVLPLLGRGRYRNVLDMNANLGGFAAALQANASTAPSAWVMNVVTVTHPRDTLGVIFERGLIGVYHNWCEPFSTYPRTYDLIHAHAIFSLISSSTKCSIESLLLEMDRILRPEGAVIIRDVKSMVEKLKPFAKAMRWDARIEPTEGGLDGPELILVCVKKYWTAS